MAPATIHRIQRNEVCRKTHIQLPYEQRLSRVPELLDTTAQFLEHVAQHGLEAVDALLGEEGEHGGAPRSVEFPVNGSEARVRETGLRDHEFVFVAGLHGVKLFVVLRVIDVELIGTDSNDGA